MQDTNRYRNKNIGPAERRLHPIELEPLKKCFIFRTLDEHADIIIRTGRLDPSSKKNIVQALESLQKRAFLISENDYRKSILSKVDATTQKSGPIEFIGIPTFNRTTELAQLFSTLLPNLKKFNRTPTIVIADDSTGTSHGANRSLIEEQQISYGGKILHLDIAAREKMSLELSRDRNIDKKITDFALLGSNDATENRYGAARNALLLVAAGKKILMLDDDVILKPRSSIQTKRHLNITSSFNGGHGYFGSYDEAVQSFSETELDYVGLHETKLGIPVQAALNNEGVGFDSLPGSMSSALFDILKKPDSKIRLTHSGIVGDSWSRFHSNFDVSSPGPHHLFGHDEQEFKRNKETPFVSRIDESDALYYGPACITVNAGIDATCLLPPFAPLYRGEDGFFGNLLNKCFGNSFSYRFPIAIEHKRDQSRLRLTEPWAHLSTIPGITKMAVNLYPSMSSDMSGAQALSEIGDHLISLAAMNSADLADLIHHEMRSQIANWRNFAQLCYAQYLEIAPEWWKKDVLSQIERSGNLDIDTLPLFTDTKWHKTPNEEQLALFKEWLLKVGSLLKAWPSMFEAFAKS